MSKKRVLVTTSHFDEFCKEAWKLLEDNDIEIVYEPEKMNVFPAYEFEELQKLLPDIDACIVGLDDYVNPAVWEISDRLKGVSKFGVGVDNFNLEVAAQHGKYVSNCPGGNSNAVAELTIGMILDLLRRICALDSAMKNYEWPRFVGYELAGKTVGLYGFGAISRLVAKKLINFDCKIIAYDPYMNEAAAKELGVTPVDEETVIREADILSLHAPATAENHHLFNKAAFEKMKDGAYLVNCARGALVDIDDLADALLSGKLAGAALDAFEPAQEGAGKLKGHKIMECENLVLTPHTGAETYESFTRVSLIAAQNVIDIVNGREPKYCVNKKFFS